MSKYQIVTNKARKGEIFESTDPIADFAARGFKFTRLETQGHLREELRRKPKFEGLCGPMWGGTDDEGNAIIRYEDWDSYNFLST